ncbi:MAG: hypothetical protein HQL90_14945 [Magnetococcales bacterium]|nr:hypothetical protein [Magnetococcales bacterium]
MISRWYESISNRERLLLLLTLVTASLAGWYQYSWIPFSQGMSEMEPHSTAGKVTEAVEAAPSPLPWREHARGWVPPAGVTVLLDHLTPPASSSGLRLAGMQVEPPRLLFSCTKGLGPNGAAALFRHELTLTLEGEFPALLSYLYRLEQMPWTLYLDHLHNSTSQPPTSTLLLEMHFFSTSPSLFVE